MSLHFQSRRILVQGVTPAQLDAHLRELGQIAVPGPNLVLRVAGPTNGWMVLDPGPTMHPYHAHNLTMWLDGLNPRPKTLIFLSNGDEPAANYWLIPDPDPKKTDDALVGFQADNTPLVVRVPDALVWRGLSHAQPLIPRTTFLLTRGVPSGLDSADLAGLPGLHELSLPFEDLGAAMNPSLEATTRTRHKGER